MLGKKTTCFLISIALFATAGGQLAHAQRISLEDLRQRIEVLEEQLSKKDAEIAELRSRFAAVSVDETGDLFIDGVNLHIRNGLGITTTTNGTGNLIVGYNEGERNRSRSGSHNVVIGRLHAYTSYGGLIAGVGNTVSGAHASVVGGVGNTAEGFSSTVTGGLDNTAEGFASNVNGGRENTAGGAHSSVSGGRANLASGLESNVSGGIRNEAGNSHASILGGGDNLASGEQSTVIGSFLQVAEIPNTIAP